MAWLKPFFSTLLAEAGILGILAILVPLLIGSEWVQENRILLGTHLLYWVLVPPVLVSIWASKSQNAFRSPDVVKVIEDNILVVRPEAWLSYRTAVAIFELREEVERIVAVGRVIHIQTSGLIHISCFNPEDGQPLAADLYEKRGLLQIKPGIWYE